jgi:IclR family transcriptional regulator, mhp operon transcriptional activator
MTAAVKEIRALARGVKVMETLCRLGACGLAELHRETGLPKSTLRRILVTLEQATFLRCSLGDGLYRPNIQIPAFLSDADASPLIGRIVAAAKPVLAELSAKASWPTDLVVRDGLQLRIVETSRMLSPFPVNRLEIGDGVDMLSSGVGRAYLAFCPQAERAEITGQMRRVHGAAALANLPRILDKIRECGYGERAPNCMGGTERHPFLIDNFHAVAVPVMNRGQVLCCINLLWRPSAVSDNRDKAKLARLLRQCAQKIAGNYKAQFPADRFPYNLNQKYMSDRATVATSTARRRAVVRQPR